MTAPKPDVVIVGGGVIGCGIAYALACEGLKVTVLERSGIASESSGAAAGILAPRVHATDDAMFPLALASHARFPSLVEALRAETGLNVEHVRSGVLELAHDEAGAEELQRKAQWLRERGHDVQWLPVPEVRELEPHLGPEVRGALHDADAYHIHPGRFTHALAQAAARRGAEFRLGIEAIGLEGRGSPMARVLTPDGVIEAPHVVLAPGSWAGACASWLGLAVPVFPVRGQILALSALPTPVRHVVFGRGIYLLPRADGTTLVGATYERVGFNKGLTAGALAGLLSAAADLCPQLAEARFERAWAGLRPGSEDELPLVGHAPGWDNVILAAGHYRNGIMLAPATAAIVADLIVRGETDLPIGPLAPGRFARS